MVGYDPQDKVHLSSTEHAFAGAFSGAISRTCIQPLDVLKIRFQLQVEPLKRTAGPKYYGIFQACRRIVGEEGLRALWKGHTPAQILSIAYGVAQASETETCFHNFKMIYASFEFLTQEVWHYLPETLTTTYRPVTHTICGGLSGCIGAAFVHPVDVIRTRFVAQGEPKVYKNLIHAVKCIMVKDGIQGYYRGLVPALSLVGPQMAAQFGLYALLTRLWDRSAKKIVPSIPAPVDHFICGSTSGFLSKLMVYPFDVIKKRLQIQGFEEARQSFGVVRKYNGFFHCIYVSFRDEGASFLFKGLSPSLLKSSAVAEKMGEKSKTKNAVHKEKEEFDEDEEEGEEKEQRRRWKKTGRIRRIHKGAHKTSEVEVCFCFLTRFI
ncbi:mitochondrial thiamine pyrophosphate carrier-like [Plakobranchus ocellatus]|uniref:Mitochondrial thiamine pyrophosphate carrier-like n=1 Tax=Plakobranchus ocellatus TaxID=259542 RepID=A0AAV4AAG9_9GAST|nr:mitochondrial thiamine pyrophosphate carrier-like [Plakobranchus ocellatus]